MTDILKCWCGNEILYPFTENYFKCGQCLTLISAGRMDDDYYRGTDQGESLYGKDYWLNHVVQLGTPDIIERARLDLIERDVYWLRDILHYKLPQGKSLELGCCHGGSVYLMKLAGFDAMGTEMSPWLCELADKTFGVRMKCGAFESLELAPNSFDVISMFDVLEHLLDPLSAVTKAAKLLKDDGVLAIQTPWCKDLDKTFEELREQNANFLVHLKENEHLYLFNKESVKSLLNKAGFTSFKFEPQIFDYDMWLFASKKPINRIDTIEVEKYLLSSSNGRTVLGFLDLYKSLECANDSIRRLNAELNELENKMKENTNEKHLKLKRDFENSLTWKMTRQLRKLSSFFSKS